MKNIINRALAAEKKLFTLLLAVAASVGTMFAENVIFSEPFSASQGSFTIDNKSLSSGLTYVWKWKSADYGMVASAYVNNSNHESESWLISPAISLVDYSSATLSFDHAINKGAPTNFEVKISADNGSTWSDLSISQWPAGNSWSFLNAAASLNSYVGKSVKIAFVYVSTTSLCPQWEIKNFKVTGNAISPGTAVSGKYKIGDLYYNLDATNHTAEVTSQYGSYSGDIVIPSSVTYNSVSYSVTSIGEWAFAYCDGLTSVTIGNSVTSIGDNTFYNCIGLTSVTIPNSVTSIGKSAFEGCTDLTSVTIPNSVTSIGKDAFERCTGLTSVTIPNSVTSIGEYAFYKCTGLTSVTIPNSVTSIGAIAFADCTGLTSVTNFANTPQEITSSVFGNVDKSTCVLYVPAGSISAYQSADVWKDFTNILPIGAQPADVTTTTVTPSATTADIAWPQVTGAATYTIEIKKNGELICTLTFNAQGQLTSIAFAAPSRNNAPQQAQAAGFAFTVTSLDSGTTYSYTMTAKGNNGNVLKTESGSFTTTGDAQGIEDVQGNNVPCTKIVHNGQIYLLRGDKTYTLTGQETIVP